MSIITKCMSYHGANGRLVITGGGHIVCLFDYIYIYIIYIYIYIYIYIVTS